MHVANIKPTKSWQALEDLITTAIGEVADIDLDKTYRITHQGGNASQIITQLDRPEDDEMGLLLHSNQHYDFVAKTNSCFIKSENGSELHIEMLE